MRASIAGWLGVMVLAASSTAQGQGTIAERAGEAAPFSLDGTVLGPIEEGGALVVFGRDLHTQADRSIRVDASGVSAGPGVDRMRVAGVARCGNTRWLLELDIQGRSYRYSVRPDGGTVSWARTMRNDSSPHTALHCAGAEPLVSFLDDGELVLGRPSSGSEQRVRLLPAGQRAEIVVRALGAATLVLLRPWERRTHPVELLRIAQGTITHSVASDADALITLDAGRALVGHTETDGSLALSVIATRDLATLSSARIPAVGAGHALRLANAWATPSSRSIVLQTSDSWLEGYVSIPQGPDEPDRFEPAHHWAVSLRTLDPRSGALGPELALGSRYASVGGWLGGDLVLFEGVEPTGVSAGVVQLRGARIRRFRVVAP